MKGVVSFIVWLVTGDGSRILDYRADDQLSDVEILFPRLFPFFHFRRPKRHRSRLFLRAHELTKKPNADFNDAWGQKEAIESLAKDYEQSVRGKSIVFRKRGTNEICQKDLMTRFHPDYAPSKRRLIRRSIDRQLIDTAVLLTLTLSPSLFSSLFDAKQGVTYGWHMLQAAIQSDLRRGGLHCMGWDGRYFLVVEFQANGAPHLHIILVGCTFLSADWVRSLWRDKWGLGSYVHMERVYGNRRKAAWYVTKYMTKGEASFTHRSLLWALNGRSFTHSQGILDDSMTNFNLTMASWEYLGVFDWSVSRSWTCYLDVLGELDPMGHG